MSEANRFEGQLVMWNVDRGFGAILPAQGGQELFVHVSAFPKDGPPPAEDDFVSFEIVSDGDGRKRAGRIQRLERAKADRMTRVLAPSSGATILRRRREERRRRITIGLVGLTLTLGVASWMQFAHPHDAVVAEDTSGHHVR
ncbi:MAG TPA: cold shock domain-containing protein [Burkholderiaceae bacterium]|jgi:cold shock CspA family protein